jgi:hypothetical protein
MKCGLASDVKAARELRGSYKFRELLIRKLEELGNLR